MEEHLFVSSKIRDELSKAIYFIVQKESTRSSTPLTRILQDKSSTNCTNLLTASSQSLSLPSSPTQTETPSPTNTKTQTQKLAPTNTQTQTQVLASTITQTKSQTTNLTPEQSNSINALSQHFQCMDLDPNPTTNHKNPLGNKTVHNPAIATGQFPQFQPSTSHLNSTQNSPPDLLEQLSIKRQCKRKRNDGHFLGTNKRVRAVNKTKISSSYKFYGKSVDLKLIKKIAKMDKELFLSSFLGMYITANDHLSKYKKYDWDPVQLVDVNQLKFFREVDRENISKNDQDPQIAIKKLTLSIKKDGFLEPLMLTYDPIKQTCQLAKGNTLLAAALQLGIPYVPVKVIISNVQDGEFPFRNPKKTWSDKSFSASELGFIVNPYLSSKITARLKQCSLESLQEVMFNYDQLIAISYPCFTLQSLFAEDMDIEQSNLAAEHS